MAGKETIKFSSVSAYVNALSDVQRGPIEALRALIMKTVPGAVEILSYNMPAYKVHGRILVYIAAHSHHSGFYPASKTILRRFADEIKQYQTSVGTLRFEHGQKLPLALLKKIILARAQENEEKAAEKAIRKPR